MSVQDITPESVCAAVLAGYDDFYKLAEQFGVLPHSHTLDGTLRALIEADRLVICDYRGLYFRYPVLAVA